MIRFASIVLTLVAAIPAQALRRTAHPQDRPHVDTGQHVPFGNFAPCAAGRSQLLIPAEYLPGPGSVLLGLEAAGMITGGFVTYRTLRITVSPVSPTAFRSVTFDDNLPQPTTIFQGGQGIQWQPGVWRTFLATQPYLHDGASSLTIDIQKLTVPGYGDGACTGLHRPDLPVMLVAFGAANSNAQQATMATVGVIPIDVRLIWQAAPTLYLSSQPPKAVHHGFAIGSNCDLVIEGLPGSPVVAQIGSSLQPPVAVPPIVGLWRLAGLTLPLPLISAQGRSAVTLPIPGQPALVGVYLVFQGVAYDVARGVLQVTNVADCFIGA